MVNLGYDFHSRGDTPKSSLLADKHTTTSNAGARIWDEPYGFHKTQFILRSTSHGLNVRFFGCEAIGLQMFVRLSLV